LELARNGVPKSAPYLAGNVGGMPVVLHGEGDRVILSKDGHRAEVDFEPRPVVTMPLPTSVTAASAPPPEIPLPVVPTAVVRSEWTGAEADLQPGASVLDDLSLPPGLGGAS